MIRPPRAIERFRTLVRVTASLGIALTITTIAPLLLTAHGGGVAHAAGETQASIAEQLFLEGKALMKEGQHQKACDKFKASHDHDASATGTLLNLALCHEIIGKPATAWAEFRRVIAESIGKREDRVALAREHEAKLLPTLSYVRIVVPPKARQGVQSLMVRLDKGAIDEATWDTDFPVDPGKHVVEVSAPGKIARAKELIIGSAAGGHQSFVVEPLADAPPTPTNSSIDLERAAADERAGKRRVIGYAVGGAGVAAVGVGVAFAITASNRNSNAVNLCPADQCPSEATKNEATSALSSAQRSANVANVLVGAGAVLIASGVVLVLTALSSSSSVPQPPPSKSSSTFVRTAFAPLEGGGGAFFLFGSVQ